jgi:N-acetylneuraminic acid mutarotase
MDGKLYVVGGFKDFRPVADLDVYDPATNSWQTLASIPTGGSARGAVLGGQFYVLVQQFSGTSSYYLSYAYNRSTNQWKAKAAPSFDQTLGGFRGGAALTKVTLDGRAGLFMATADQSALYTP